MVDEESFYEVLLENHGIEKDWIEWADKYSVLDPCFCARDLSTVESVNATDEAMEFSISDVACPCAGRADYTMYMNFPRRIKDSSKINVPNPKDIIDKAIPKTGELEDLLKETYEEAWYDELDASGDDAATSFSMSVFMLEDAIESIKTVKEIGEKQKETKTRELVMNILTIVFAVIPFVGSAASAVGGAAAIARAALIVGEAGNAALSIVEIVDDPLSAPFAIIGLLIGAGGLKVKGPRTAFKEAADARHALKGDKLKAFSPEFRRKDEIVQGLLKRSNQCLI